MEMLQEKKEEPPIENVTWDMLHQVKPTRHLKDKECFTIPITLGNLSIDHTLLDLGASCNLMPYSFLEKIGCLNLKAHQHDSTSRRWF